MEPKTVRPVAKAIQDRFFEALKECIQRDRIAGLQTFCKDYGFHKAKYSKLRSAINDPSKTTRYKFIDIDALYYIVKELGVSADWLLTGRGRMFK